MELINKNNKFLIRNNLKMELDVNRSLIILNNGEQIECGVHGISILEQFRNPNTLHNALKHLNNKSKSIQDWISLMNTIIGLVKSNILIEQNSYSYKLNNKPSGYNSASFHIALLNDRVRTKSFIKAIRKTVKKGDIVLDIGTGTGLLAIAAAKYGAKHVYAMESSSIADIAKLNIRENGFKNKITLLRGTSTQLDIREKADLLVSEIIGNEPLGENILEVFSDSFKRHLKKDARIIPQRLKIYCLPLSVPFNIVSKYFINRNHIKRWKSNYGIDFSAMEGRDNSDQYEFYINSFKAKKWNYLSEAILLTEINLNSITSLSIKIKKESKIDKTGLLNGLLIFFESLLCPGVTLTTHPEKVTKSNSWSSKVWLLRNPVKVLKNQRITIRYNYSVPKVGNKIMLDI